MWYEIPFHFLLRLRWSTCLLCRHIFYRFACLICFAWKMLSSTRYLHIMFTMWVLKNAHMSSSSSCFRPVVSNSWTKVWHASLLVGRYYISLITICVHIESAIHTTYTLNVECWMARVIPVWPRFVGAVLPLSLQWVLADGCLVWLQFQ